LLRELNRRALRKDLGWQSKGIQPLADGASGACLGLDASDPAGWRSTMNTPNTNQSNVTLGDRIRRRLSTFKAEPVVRFTLWKQTKHAECGWYDQYRFSECGWASVRCCGCGQRFEVFVPPT
jgi:hypothetical protein